MRKIQLPEFKGKPLIEIPAYIPQADFLRGDFGKAVLEEYNARVQEEYQNNDNLHILSYKNDTVIGSNSFAVTLLNQILSEYGLHTAIHADLEKILKINALPLRGTYEDSALALRSEENPNEYLARDLTRQIKKRNLLEYPVMFSLHDVTLRNDSDSPYGLAFDIKENAKIISVPILNKQSGYFSPKDIDEKTGLPNKIQKQGERYFYTRNSGLSRVYLINDLNVVSDNENLGISVEHGRVVVVSDAEGAPKNFASKNS